MFSSVFISIAVAHDIKWDSGIRKMFWCSNSPYCWERPHYAQKNIKFLSSLSSNYCYRFGSSYRRCSIKILFLKILQNSQETTGAWVSLISFRAQPATLLKKRLTEIFPDEFCEIFQNIFLQNTSGNLTATGLEPRTT